MLGLGPVHPVPEIVVVDHLVDYFREVGPAEGAGDSLAPLSYAEIESWARLRAVPLLPWESKALREMSAAYVEWIYAGKDATCKNPWTKAPVDSATAKAVFDGMKKEKGARARGLRNR